MNRLPRTQDVRVPSSGKYNYVESVFVRVHVGTGTDSKDFFVYEELISPRSAFFAHALNGSWKESDDRVVPLPEDEPEVFSLYLKLLNTNSLLVKNLNPNVSDQELASDEYLLLCKLYVLAEKLVDPTAQHAALAAIKARAEEHCEDVCIYYPTDDCIHAIYDGTPDGSPARQLLVNLYTTHANATMLSLTDIKHAPNEFLYEVLVSIAAERPLRSELWEAQQDSREDRDAYEHQIAELAADVEARDAQIASLEMRLGVAEMRVDSLDNRLASRSQADWRRMLSEL